MYVRLLLYSSEFCLMCYSNMIRKIIDFILLIITKRILIYSKSKDIISYSSIIDIGSRYFGDNDYIELKTDNVFETEYSSPKVIDITISSGKMKNSIFIYIGQRYFKIGVGTFRCGCNNDDVCCKLNSSENNNAIVKYIDNIILKKNDKISICFSRGFVSIYINNNYICSTCDIRAMDKFNEILRKNNSKLEISTLIKNLDVYIYRG